MIKMSLRPRIGLWITQHKHQRGASQIFGKGGIPTPHKIQDRPHPSDRRARRQHWLKTNAIVEMKGVV